MRGTKGTPLYSSCVRVRYFSLSSASEALETSSRRKISVLRVQGMDDEREKLVDLGLELVLGHRRTLREIDSMGRCARGPKVARNPWTRVDGGAGASKTRDVTSRVPPVRSRRAAAVRGARRPAAGAPPSPAAAPTGPWVLRSAISGRKSVKMNPSGDDEQPPEIDAQDGLGECLLQRAADLRR